jgi:hypothetical protein
MGRWLALAEKLADDAREPGFGAAASVAAAWAARVDPMATRSLVRAALMLAGTDVIPALYAPLPPCPDAATLLEWGENLESHVADLLKRCTGAGAAARGERSRAIEAGCEAASAAREAPPGEELDEARLRERAAAQVTADCEACMDLLGQADAALRCALDCVRSLPGDLDEAYEAAGRLIAAGGVLPHSGDFIAPTRIP